MRFKIKDFKLFHYYLKDFDKEKYLPVHILSEVLFRFLIVL